MGWRRRPNTDVSAEIRAALHRQHVAGAVCPHPDAPRGTDQELPRTRRSKRRAQFAGISVPYERMIVPRFRVTTGRETVVPLRHVGAPTGHDGTDPRSLVARAARHGCGRRRDGVVQSAAQRAEVRRHAVRIAGKSPAPYGRPRHARHHTVSRMPPEDVPTVRSRSVLALRRPQSPKRQRHRCRADPLARI